VKLLIATLLTLFLLACSSDVPEVNETTLMGGWRASEILSVTVEGEEADLFIKEMLEDELIAEGYVLFFFEDGQYAELTGYQLSSGEWRKNGEGTITFGDNQLTSASLSKEGGQEFLTAEIGVEGENFVATQKWVRESVPTGEPERDPFHPALNHWRIRPASKETDAEIRQRLINYLDHFAAILFAADQREQGVVSFRHSLGIVKVYHGGIGRIPVSRIPDEWIDCFYDREDAMSAYRLFGHYLSGGTYKGGTTGSWIKDDYRILRKIRQLMEEDEEEIPLPEEPAEEDGSLKT